MTQRQDAGPDLDVAVIGAGMTGITCARDLAAAGLRVALYDKGRGIGGRMATRRLEGGLLLDHGAQYLRPRHAAFAAFLDEAQRQGHAATWDPGDGPAFVGARGMAGLMRGLAQGLEIQQNAQITALTPLPQGWRLTFPGGVATARRVVLTIPPAQAAALIGTDHALADVLGTVVMAPSITLLAVLDATAPRPFTSRRGLGATGWIAQDGTKPGRPADGPVSWILQTDADFARDHIDMPPETLTDLLVPKLCAALEAAPAQVLSASAHRWLYAQAATQLGRPFLSDRAAGMWIGGDWCLGPLAEDAWASGSAIAADIAHDR